MGSRLLSTVNAVTTPISGKTGIGRHSRARDEQQATCLAQSLDDAIDRKLVTLRENRHCLKSVNQGR